MPKKGDFERAKPTTRPPSKRFSDVVFVSYPLVQDQLAQIKGLQWTLDDFDLALEDLNDKSYKVTFSRDEYNDCYSSYVIPVGDQHPNAGYILTGRGSCPWKALRQAVYIHHVIFEGDWSTWTQARRGDPIDD